MYTRFLQNPVPRLISFISYSTINKVFVSLVGFQENEGLTAGSTKSHGFKSCTINSSQIAVLDLFFHIVIKILFPLRIRRGWVFLYASRHKLFKNLSRTNGSASCWKFGIQFVYPIYFNPLTCKLTFKSCFDLATRMLYLETNVSQVVRH